jgi:aspartate carbamoyltransferase catalytic subunit
LTWSHHHVLDLEDFSREEIEAILETASAMKEVLTRPVPKVPTLRGKRVFSLFFEPSTRTRASFELAAKTLSAEAVGITAQASSVVKGESLLDTMKTLEALGADAVVLRHPEAGAPYLAARYCHASIVNAGDGAHAHPTQALLDLFTLRQRLGDLEGLKVVIVGDILHSRVARSNIWGLKVLGARVVLCGPPTLLPPQFGDAYPEVEVEGDLGRALEGAGAVIALRLQRERQQDLIPSLEEYVAFYQLNASRLSRALPGALVLHPGPVNEGVEIDPEVARGPQSLIDEQVTNGVAVRMALLYLLLGGGAHE